MAVATSVPAAAAVTQKAPTSRARIAATARAKLSLFLFIRLHPQFILFLFAEPKQHSGDARRRAEQGDPHAGLQAVPGLRERRLGRHRLAGFTGLAGFIALVTLQVRSIIRSPFPGLRAVEALAISVPLFLLLFAATYVVLANLSTRNFGGHLSHTDGLYFTVAVFSTVGFGDITAKTETARLVVTGQMIADLIILGLAIKVIVGAVKLGRRRQNSG